VAVSATAPFEGRGQYGIEVSAGEVEGCKQDIVKGINYLRVQHRAGGSDRRSATPLTCDHQTGANEGINVAPEPRLLFADRLFRKREIFVMS